MKKPVLKCMTCGLPQEIQEQIWDMHVRQDLRPIQVYGQIKELLDEQGIKAPAQASFYRHLTNHLDPEKMALARVARSADRVDTKGGLKGIALSYLVDQLNREKKNRDLLQGVIDKIKKSIDDGKAIITLKDGTSIQVDMGPFDLSTLAKALGYLVKIRSDDRGVTELVESKIMEDLVAGIVMMAGRAVVEGLRQVKDEMGPRLQARDREEIFGVLDKGFEQIMKSLEGVYQEAVSEVGTIVKKGRGSGGAGGE